MTDELPSAQCPKCKEWLADYDGLGVLYHDKCGYCSHASITDDVCEFCGGDIWTGGINDIARSG